MPIAADLVVSLVVTWGLGLAPALVARYVWKKGPLSAWQATLIAGISCATFAIAFLIIRSALGETNARISPAWMLVFLVSRAIMMRGKRAELVRRLREMIADPATTEEHRALAQEKLGQLEAITTKRARTLQLAVAGGPPTARGQTDRHPERQVRLRHEQGDGQYPESAPLRAWLRRNGRIVAYVLGGALLLNLILMLSGYRVLVGEKIVPAGERYQTAEWVHGSDDGAVILCWYWTGRSVKEVSRWYGQRGRQIDECPLLLDVAEGL